MLIEVFLCLSPYLDYKFFRKDLSLIFLAITYYSANVYAKVYVCVCVHKFSKNYCWIRLYSYYLLNLCRFILIFIRIMECVPLFQSWIIYKDMSWLDCFCFISPYDFTISKIFFVMMTIDFWEGWLF